MSETSAPATYKTLFIIAIAILVVAPLFYLIVAYAFLQPMEMAPYAEMLTYMFLIVAVVTPALNYPIRRFQISQYRKNPTMAKGAAGLAMTLNIISMALVEAVYIYGLVIYLLTYQFETMLWFYAIGIVWTILRWPTRSRFEKLVKELSSYGTT